METFDFKVMMDSTPIIRDLKIAPSRLMAVARWRAKSGLFTKEHVLDAWVDEAGSVARMLCGVLASRIDLMQGTLVATYTLHPDACKLCRHEAVIKPMSQWGMSYLARQQMKLQPDWGSFALRGVVGQDASTKPPGIQWPTWVRSDDDRRRWELSLRTILYAFGWQVGEPLDSGDRAVIAQGARSLYFGTDPTGDGDVTEEERRWMHEQGVL